MKKMIGLDKLPALWEQLSAEGPLYLPIEERGVVCFKPWYEGAVVRLDALNGVVPPKDIFLPREETYMRYQGGSQTLEIEAVSPGPDDKATLFGVHPCDLKAVEMLDRVYIDQEPGDSLYRRRRENATVVALACSSPDPFCFCNLFEVDPADAPGADIMAYLSEQSLYLETRTEKGETMLAKAESLISDAKDEPERPREVKTTDFGLYLEGLSDNLKERFDDPAWDNLYKSCLSCGVCTYVCPTCYCFDVEDFGHEGAGERFRCWDSCMFGHFTQMAGGHNPRPDRKERVRQRFLHKLQYYPQTYGEIACVGCGRCLRSCPVNLDIVQAVKALGGEAVEQR